MLNMAGCSAREKGESSRDLFWKLKAPYHNGIFPFIIYGPEVISSSHLVQNRSGNTILPVA